MKTWLIMCGIVWIPAPIVTLRSLPQLAENVVEEYLGNYLRRRNELKGINDPEMYLDVPELVRNRGYLLEIHEVFTDDGYGLVLHRISSRIVVSTSKARPVVFFQHGLWQSSACWLLNTVDKALPYVLADQGYDVWLGNFRGNTYSQKHKRYNTHSYQYWDFSWDEMAKYDLPAMLKFVLAHTHQKDLTYVGHSLGCAAFFAFADTHPELQPLVNVMVGLGPASVMPNMRAPVRLLTPYVTQLELLFKILGTTEFLPNSNLVRFLEQAFCTKNDLKPRKCENVAFQLSGSDPANFNHTLVPLITRHSPAGSSVRTVAQFAQGVNSKRFQKYDWGRAENRRRYGQSTPPEYSLGNVKVPVVLFYGDNDWLVGPEVKSCINQDFAFFLHLRMSCVNIFAWTQLKDAAVLARRLGNLKGFYRVPMDEFNHMDFLFALHIDTLLNKDVRKEIETYNPPP